MFNDGITQLVDYLDIDEITRQCNVLKNKYPEQSTVQKQPNSLI